MQKLMSAVRRGGNNRGSSLITAVVLALIMAFAGVGFLLVTTNSINNDSDAYTRDKAFYAAESGAIIAAKYLMSRTYNSWPATPYTFYSNKQINGLYVTVVIGKNTISKQDTVKSEAFTSSTTHNVATFKRRVVIIIQSDT